MKIMVWSTCVASILMLVQATTTHASFMGKNGRIAFSDTVGSPYGPWQIFEMNPDGTGAKQITDVPGSPGNPAYSRDGRQIAYDADGRIFIVGPYGETRLLPLSLRAWDPAWSPDGQRLAFTSAPNEEQEDIYVVRTNGKRAPVNLTNSPDSDDHSPVWSRDGKTIVYESKERRLDSDSDIYVVRASGRGTPRNLTNSPEEREWSPDWSPDGKRIVFIKDFLKDEVLSEIFMMDADGSRLRRITNDFASDGRPVWSPDGHKIAFVSNRSTPSWQFDIYVMNVDGSGIHQLTGTLNVEHSPDWQAMPASASLGHTPLGRG